MRPSTRFEPYRLAGPLVRAGAVVIDSAVLGFAPESLVVTTNGYNAPLPTAAFDVSGAIGLQFVGKTDCGVYARRFHLGAWCSQELTVSPFRWFQLSVIGNTLLGPAQPQGFDLVAILSDGTAASQPAPLLYREVASQASVVPWGAYEMIPAQADAGFSWELDGTSIAQAVVAGTSYPVAGLRYVPSVLPFSAVWRVRA